MKIKRIDVKNLFGIFNHEVKFKDGGITIVIGENGLGKTVILEMINAFFNRDYQYFDSVEFDMFQIEFMDGVTWNIRNDKHGLKVREAKTNRSYKIKFDRDSKGSIFHARRIAEYYPNIRREDRNIWRDMYTGETLDSIDVIRKYDSGYKYSQQNFFDEQLDIENEQEWFASRIEGIDVNLIKTQRLLVVGKEISSLGVTRMVNKYSEELKNEISNKLAQSTALSSELDRTYPQRLIKYISMQEKNTNSIDILDKLQELEAKRKTLATAGLMDIGNESDILNTNDINSNMIKDVLMQYILDSFKKLDIFDEICKKIQLLLSIINNRFKHKRLFIDKNNGFNFKSTIIRDAEGKIRPVITENEAKIIPVNKLSSGEQNELILFYELIFKAKENSLILIDEPEISLHISWQNNFINDLKKINEINNLEVLIATHSPDIIGNYWEKSTELMGEE